MGFALFVLGYCVSSPYQDLKMQALQSAAKVTLQSTEPTIRRGTYSVEGGNYTIKEDIYGSISADIRGFAQQLNHLAVVKKSPQINLQGHYFADVEKSLIVSVKKTLEDDNDISVYEIEPVEFLSVFSYIHAKTSYKGNEQDICDLKSKPIHCEKENLFNWDKTEDSPILKNIQNSIEIGAGAYTTVMVDVDFELTGMSNFKLVVEPKFIGKIGAEFLIHQSELILLSDYNIFHLNAGCFPLYQIGFYGMNFALRLNVTSDIIIRHIMLNFTKDFQYKKGFQLTVSKKFVLTSGKDKFSSNQDFEYSIQDLPDSVPTFQLIDFDYLKNETLSILQSIHVSFQADISLGARLFLSLESFSSLIPSNDNLFSTDLILNPIFDADLSIDLENCLLPFIKFKFKPRLDFKFGYSDLTVLGQKLINQNQYTFTIFTFQEQEKCLFNPSSTDEASITHISSPSTEYYNYRLTPHLAMKQDSSSEPSESLYITFSQLNSDGSVLSSSQCYFSSLQYTQTSLDTISPSSTNECSDWLISKANSDTQLMISASYDNTGLNAHWNFVNPISKYEDNNFIYYDYKGTLVTRRLFVHFDIEQISTIEFDKLFTSNSSYVAFENDISVPEYTFLKKVNNKYQISTVNFKSFVINSKTQQTIWKNLPNDEYVQFMIKSITTKNYCTGNCGSMKLNFTYDGTTPSDSKIASFKAEDFNDDKEVTLNLENVFPYPDGTYYSSVANRKYTLQLTITNFGCDYKSPIYSISPNDDLQTLTFQDDSSRNMITISYYLKKVKPLIYCQVSGSGVIVQATPITLNPTSQYQSYLSGNPSYTILDVNLKTTKPYDTVFPNYMLLQFFDYKPITSHIYYSDGVAAILADSSNVIQCSDGYNHLFLSFRKDETSSNSHKFWLYRFTAVVNKDDMSLEKSSNIHIYPSSSFSYPPYIGGTNFVSSIWGYHSTIKGESSSYDYQFTIFDYTKFTLALMPESSDFIRFYQDHYTMGENEMELTIDLTSLYLNESYSNQKYKLYIQVNGSGKFKFDGNVYNSTNTYITFTKYASELTNPLTIVRVCNNEITSLCLMTLESNDTIVLKYNSQSTDGIYLYGNSSSKLGPGVYYDIFTGGKIEFWKTWEGTLESMKHYIISSSDQGQVKASLQLKENNIILSFKYAKQSYNSKLLEEITLPISRDAIMHSGDTEEILSLQSNTILMQDEDGNLVFPKNSLKSEQDIQISKDSLNKLIGLSSSQIQNSNLNLQYSDLFGSETGSETVNTGKTRNNDNKKSKTGVIIGVVGGVVVLSAVIVVIVIFVIRKKKSNVYDSNNKGSEVTTTYVSLLAPSL